MLKRDKAQSNNNAEKLSRSWQTINGLTFPDYPDASANTHYLVEAVIPADTVFIAIMQERNLDQKACRILESRTLG